MNYFLKYKFALWTVIILTVMVITATGTFMTIRLTHNFNKGDKYKDKRNIELKQFWKELSLTEAQQNQFDTIQKQLWVQTRPLFDSLENNRLKMIHEMSQTTPDTAKLYQLCNKTGDFYTQLRKNYINHLLRLQSLCNPEQLLKIKTLNDKLIRPERQIHREKR